MPSRKQKKDNKEYSIIMYNVPEQQTNDIEYMNTPEFQSIDDFITKGIIIGGLIYKTCQSNGQLCNIKKGQSKADSLYIYREEFSIANI